MEKPWSAPRPSDCTVQHEYHRKRLFLRIRMKLGKKPKFVSRVLQFYSEVTCSSLLKKISRKLLDFDGIFFHFHFMFRVRGSQPSSLRRFSNTDLILNQLRLYMQSNVFAGFYSTIRGLRESSQSDIASLVENTQCDRWQHTNRTKVISKSRSVNVKAISSSFLLFSCLCDQCFFLDRKVFCCYLCLHSNWVNIFLEI